VFVTLMTGAYVSRLGTDASGRTVDAVHVTRDGREEVYTADTVIVACGALSSALMGRVRSGATTCATT